MIARVKAAWPTNLRMTVILVEDGQSRAVPLETVGYFWLPDEGLQGQLAQSVAGKDRRFAVQLSPPNNWGHHHIELFEMIHEPRDLKAETDALLNEAERSETRFAQEDHCVDDERFRQDRAHGMTRRIRQ